MKHDVITDIDGEPYNVYWADDHRSADITHGEDRLCIVYATKRNSQTVWFSTETSDVYITPMAAIMATTAEMRRVRKPIETAIPQPSPAVRPKKSWRELAAKTVDARPPANKWHHRKDFD